MESQQLNDEPAGLIQLLAEKVARLELAVFGPPRVPLSADLPLGSGPHARATASGEQAFLAIDPQPASTGLHGLEWSATGTPFRWTRDFARFSISRAAEGGEKVELVALAALPAGSVVLYCGDIELKPLPGRSAEPSTLCVWSLPKRASSETSVLTLVSRTPRSTLDDPRLLGIPFVSLVVRPQGEGAR